MMAARDVKAYLGQMKNSSATPEIAQHWVMLEQNYNKRYITLGQSDRVGHISSGSVR